MIYLYLSLVVMVCLWVGYNIYFNHFFMDAKRRGKLPPKGRATMYDVRHLLMEGEKELAVAVYCEIFQITPGKAKKDIEELERSLKV